MNRRLLVATVAVVVLATVAGCLGTGLSEDALAEDQSYDWNATTTANASYDVERGGFLSHDEARAVFEIDDQDEIELYRRGITRTRPVSIRSIQFRHADGTTVDHEEIFVDQSSRRTVVEPPASEGQLAITIELRPRSFNLVTTYNGSYRMQLPPGYRVGDFLLSDVQPGGYESDVEDDTQTLHWDEVDGGETMIVRYYQENDWYIFYGLVAGLLVVGLVGYRYYTSLLEQLAEWRDEQGLEVDDDRREPPPGFG